MPVQSVGPSLKKFCEGNGSPDAPTAPEFPKIADSPTLMDFMLKMSMYYPDTTYGVSETDRKIADGKKAPKTAQDVWTSIATQLVNNFHSDRDQTAIPKNRSDAQAQFKPVPTVTQIAASPVPAGVGGEALAVVKKTKAEAIQKAMIAWFEENYKDAVKKGKATFFSPDLIGRNGKSKSFTEIDTVPTNTNAVSDLETAWNEYWKSATFTATIPLPEILVPKPSNPPPKFFPQLAPQKDFDSEESAGADGGNTSTPATETEPAQREGGPGFVIGPFDRQIQVEEIAGSTVTIKDGPQSYTVPKYKLVGAPIDKDTYIIDSEKNQELIKSKLNYAAFLRGKKDVFGEGPTDLPINGGKNIEVPGAEGEPPTILQAKGLNTSGKQTPGGQLLNDNKGNPIEDPSYGVPNFSDEPAIGDWVDQNGNAIIGRGDKGTEWGGTPLNRSYGNSKAREEEVQNYQSTLKSISPTAGEMGEKDLSYSDPRTWGPWEEYKRESDKARRYKHLVPTGLATAKAAADDSALTEADQPGARINGQKCLPVMNKMYWGFRLREAFPDATSDADAVNQAIKGSQPPGMPDAATVVIKGGTVVISGPIPPLKIKESGSTFSFTWKNNDVLLNGGKVSRGDGDPFRSKVNKETPAEIVKNLPDKNTNNAKTVNTIGKHINDGQLGVDPKLDQKVKGTAKGGMTYFDASKQIFFPFFTPPAKPFLPNSETINWGP